MPALTRRRDHDALQETWLIYFGDMMPRIAMMKALHRHQPRSESAPRRKRAKSFRIVR
jgi:hypothetical protein